MSTSFGIPVPVTPLPTVTPTISPTNPPSETWETLASGLERRMYMPAIGNGLGMMVVLRIDPALYTFRAHYEPGTPRTLARWAEYAPDAVAFVNANFFDPQFRILGLLVADGVAHGSSYQNIGGMFQIENGVMRVRSLADEPYQGEALDQAVQAFPMLVRDGQAIYTQEDNATSRRTVIAQDSEGRILLIVTPLVGLTLAQMSAYLPTTDLNIVNALNLDGGGSTMMYIGAEEPPYMMRSLDAVPAILAVYSRD